MFKNIISDVQQKVKYIVFYCDKLHFIAKFYNILQCNFYINGLYIAICLIILSRNKNEAAAFGTASLCYALM